MWHEDYACCSSSTTIPTAISPFSIPSCPTIGMLPTCFAPLFSFQVYLFPTHTQLVVSKKIKSIFRSLVVPLSLFSTLFTFPKAFIHQQDVSISESLFNIVSGQSSWFICALVVSEVLFVGLVQLFKGNKISRFHRCL